MNLTKQDLIKGQDFSAYNPQTAQQHNNLVDFAKPWTDGVDESEGIGLLLTTTDTDAAGTPNVPIPDGETLKWKRYIWVRRPFNDSSITNTSCQVYGWNDSAIPDPVFKKWQLIDPASYITLSEASKTVHDGYVENAKTKFTSVQANFTAADLGKLVSGPGIPVGTIIVAISASTPNEVMLSQKATSAEGPETYIIQYNSTLPYRTIIDATLTNKTIVSPTGNFVPADVGMLITGENIAPDTIIQSVQSSTNATMSINALVNGGPTTVSIAYKAGSPLNAAINYAVDMSNNAYSTSIAANNNVAALQAACLTQSPSSVSPPLQTQIANNAAGINSANLNNNTIWNWLSGDLTDITKDTVPAKINFRVKTLETSVANLQTSSIDISKLAPGASGTKLRTNSAATPAVEWYNPAVAPEILLITCRSGGVGAGADFVMSDIVVSDGTTTMPTFGGTPGTYLVQFWTTHFWGYSSGVQQMQFSVTFGDKKVRSWCPATALGITTTDGCAHQMHGMAVISPTASSTIKATNESTLTIGGSVNFLILIQRISTKP